MTTFPLSFISHIPNKVESALILLHGYGANGEDMAQLIPDFSAAFPAMAIYCPTAPIFPSDNPDIPALPEWYPIESELQALHNPKLNDFDDIIRGLSAKGEQTFPALEKFIRAVMAKHNLPAHKVIIGGFSQGGHLAMVAGLSFTPPLAGVISFSGFAGLDGTRPPKSTPPILLTHGDADDMLPFKTHEASVMLLKSLGLKTKEVVLTGEGHTINDKAIAAAISFARQTLK